MKPIKFKSRQASFFKRHKHKLTILGASIVFLTYVVKEIWRDSLKESRDGIASAMIVYDSKMYQLPNKTQANANADEILTTTYFVSDLDLTKADITLQQQFRNIQKADSDTDRMFSAIELLASQLPVTKSIAEGRKNYADNQDMLNTDYEIAHEHLFSPQAVEEFDALRNPARYITTGRMSVASFATTMSSKADTVFAYGELVRKEAEHIREEMKHKYERINVASYILYAIGWGLGLAGRLYGGGDIIGGE